jgi:hypothetical protein
MALVMDLALNIIITSRAIKTTGTFIVIIEDQDFALSYGFGSSPPPPFSKLDVPKTEKEIQLA